MPKTYGGLWEEIVSWDTMVAAYERTRSGRRYQPEVLRFHEHWEERLMDICIDLQRGTWQPRPLTRFSVLEPKPRIIEAPAYQDRIVHHAIVDTVTPLFERRFIEHSYACREGKGTHAAVETVQRYMREAERTWNNPYVLQADIRKYFPSIGHERLLQQLARVIRGRILAIWRRIIEGVGRDTGLPIGALTSQLGANVYLDVLDHFVKDELGIRAYVRYMDDTVYIVESKAAAWELLGQIQTFLRDELGLELNPKTRIYPMSHGIDFAGYRTYPTHIAARKRNVYRARRRVRRLLEKWRAGEVDADTVMQCAASFRGYARHCQASRVSDELESALQEVAA